MLSKREKLFAAVSDLHGLICPVCRQLLSRQGDNLICAGGHAINVNRRGCVNLLSAQADTFYDAALFAARERVFAAGCYQPVADAIDALLPDAPQKLLDAGCGEGWYLNALLTRRTDSIGAGIDIAKPDGHMIVDIGGGTTDIAVISLSGIVESTSIKIAGDQFDEAIVKYIRRKHNVLIGERTAEELKMQIGCVFPRPEEQTLEIKGRCLMTGLPRVFTVSSSEMIEAFEEVSTRILEAIHGVLERTPPELVADISTNGIVMTGGGSLVWGFDKLIESHTGIETHVADDAISCVAYGTGKSLENVSDMQDGTINLSRRKQMN